MNDENRPMTEHERTLFSEAVSLASGRHSVQARKNGEPYIWHPICVAAIVRRSGYGYACQTAAILHDILEDTETDEQDLEIFGEDVVKAVKLLTRKDNQKEEDYVSSILANRIASIVKSADIINNMMDSGILGRNPEKTEWSLKYIEKAKKYYKGKFCKAVDEAIGCSEFLIENKDASSDREWTLLDRIVLYGNKDTKTYRNASDWYRNRTDEYVDSSPWRFRNTDADFIKDSVSGNIFCIEKKKPGSDGNVWMLGKAGWYKTDYSPVEQDEYGESIEYFDSKEAAYREIDRLISEKWFMDFVNCDEL